MKNLVTLIGAFFLFMSLNSFAVVTDYIDIKPMCDELETASTNVVMKEDSACNNSKSSPFKENKIHNLSVKRVDSDSKDIEKIETQMDESDLSSLCEELKKNKSDKVNAIAIDYPFKDKSKKWRVVVTFGPFMAFYAKMKMRLRNGDTDVKIGNLGPVQRTSFKYYDPSVDGALRGKFIDEPQNDITIEIVNDKMFFGVRYSHPKILFQDNHDNPHINHHVEISGKIGGVEVDEKDVNLDKYIHTLSTSHGNVNANVFGGRKFTLSGDKDKNHLELRLGVGAGVSFANGVSKYWAVDENNERKLKITEYKGMKVYGFNLSGESTLRYNFLKGRMNASLNVRGLYTRFDGPVGEFRATGNVLSVQTGISIGYKSKAKSKNKKAQRKIAQLKKIEEEELEKSNSLQAKQ
jgi:hypothetical protein